MPVRSLDHFRRTTQLFIDTATLRHLHHLHRHYKADLLEVGRSAGTVRVTRGGNLTPLGHYTVRVQDTKTIRDIEIFINKAGEVTEEDSLTIYPSSEDETLIDELDQDPSPSKKTSKPRKAV